MYRGKVQPFLAGLGADAARDLFGTLTAERIGRYLQRQAPRFARTTRKDLVVALRSFLRFVWGRGYLPHDLSHTLIRVPCFSQDRLTQGPKWTDVAKLLDGRSHDGTGATRFHDCADAGHVRDSADAARAPRA
jgi:hypothetical protein